MEDKLLKSTEAARLLGVTPQTVRVMFEKGKFPNAFKIGVSVRIPASDVEAAKKRPKKAI